MERKLTRAVTFGGVSVGGTSPVLIQSMTNTDTADAQATIAQIEKLKAAGCEAVRCTFNNTDCAPAFKDIKKSINIPLIADVHFDPKLAILAIESGADKVRVNPGNIGGFEALKSVAQAARANNAAIRIGVNSGSLEKELLKKYGGPTPQAMAESALNSVRYVYDLNFFDIVVSIKASSVPGCVEATRIFSEKCDAPLHVGITEAGTYENAIIKSAVGLGTLLLEGIGDTIRVSITGDPVQEVYAAKKILQAAGIRHFNPEIISCPTCGRTKIDIPALAAEAEKILIASGKTLTAAVMGCVVNGPGEAKNADIGIAGGDGRAALFSKGELLGSYDESEILNVFKKYIEENF